MGERYTVLARFPWPAVDAQSLAAALGWVMAAVVLGVAVWAADGPLRRWMNPSEPIESTPGGQR